MVVDDDKSPTDRYVVAGVAAEHERALRTVHTHPETGLDMETLRAAVDEDVAVVVLSLVSHRSGALLDMAEVHGIAQTAQGALVLWDLSHAVGAVDLQLAATGADGGRRDVQASDGGARLAGAAVRTAGSSAVRRAAGARLVRASRTARRVRAVTTPIRPSGAS